MLLNSEQKAHLLALQKKYGIGITGFCNKHKGTISRTLIVILDTVSCPDEYIITKRRFHKTRYSHNFRQCSEDDFVNQTIRYAGTRKKALTINKSCYKMSKKEKKIMIKKQ